ncbi:hypothetical protein NQZ68_018976 [Dissostichus eleginoides]|nr:hypothetical protein NQZ68_018976 [Dissostichus eleginoides]
MPLSSGIILSASGHRRQQHSMAPSGNMPPLRTEQQHQRKHLAESPGRTGTENL